jgi:hypothetical protein
MGALRTTDQPPAPSDEELLRRWLDDSLEDSGETFIAIYTRFRGMVREEMERTGLVPHEAEQRVGSVFIRAEDTRESMPAETSLRDRLVTVAREVARDTNWSPPLWRNGAAGRNAVGRAAAGLAFGDLPLQVLIDEGDAGARRRRWPKSLNWATKDPVCSQTQPPYCANWNRNEAEAERCDRISCEPMVRCGASFW